MVNINKLKGKIAENGLSIGQLAEKMGVNKSTLYRKFAGNGDTFSIAEADSIAKILSLDANEAQGIFFSQIVA